MKKINFEDGQLVSAGYIEIDGTQHEIHEAEYEGSTPLSAHTLNLMQTNIEEEINNSSIIVSPTEPTTNRKKIWMQKGKNLFDKNSANMQNLGFVSATGEIVSENNKRLTVNNYIRLEKGTYTLSFINANQVWILAYDLQKNYKGNGYIQSSWENTNSKTFTLNEECLIRFSISKTDNTEMSLNKEYNIKLEVEQKIHVLNDNNVYEEFIRKEEIITNNVTLIENLAYAHKFGKVVSFVVFGTKTLTINDKTNITLTTLPEGFRPRANIGCPIILKDSSWNCITGASMIIRTTGVVEISQASGKNITANQILANCTFITS